jgi:hypothetical protein
MAAFMSSTSAVAIASAMLIIHSGSG